MREIKASYLTEHIKDLCIEANIKLPQDVRRSIEVCMEQENYPLAKESLQLIVKNYTIAESESVPICQDTGLACVFVEIGQEVCINGNLEEAINEGVRQGYKEGYLRASVVIDPLDRKNTKDNTPAMIYYDIASGDGVKITVAPKGFGSENMSRLKMLKPSEGLDGVKAFILETVELAGANPCPPIVVGVGIGGTFDKAALMAKKALTRDTDDVNPNQSYANLEAELLEEVNKLGIGPQGFGGRTTAIAVKINHMPTHIAGLPVAVNINCHVARHVSRTI